MLSQKIKDHWSKVADMGCLISKQDPQLHHCHGGSMRRFGMLRGKGQKPSDWLVIPIAPRYHVGEFGIDSGQPFYGVVENWEEAFGTQVNFLIKVCDHVGYDVFSLADLPDSPWQPPQPKWMDV